MSASVALTKEEKKERRREMRAARRDGVKAYSRLHWQLLLFLLVASVVIELAAILISLVYDMGADENSSILNSPYVFWGLQIFSMYIVAFPLFIKGTKKLPSANYGKEGLGLKLLICYYFISEAAMKFGNLTASLFAEIFAKETGIDLSGGSITTSDIIYETPLWLLLLVIVILAPIVEEIMFRKIMIDKMGAYNVPLAIFSSSLAFALFHGNFIQAVYTFFFGLILGSVYARSRRIGYCIALHMVINLSGSLPSLLFEAGYISEEILTAVYFIPAFIGLAIVIPLAKSGKLDIGVKTERSMGFLGVIRAGLLNLGTLAFIAVFVGMIIFIAIPAGEINPEEFLPGQDVEAIIRAIVRYR